MDKILTVREQLKEDYLTPEYQTEWDKLLAEKKQAEQNFDLADTEHVEGAIFHLKTVESKINAYLRELKQGVQE